MRLFRYCPQCGEPLAAQADQPQRVAAQACRRCGVVHYRSASPGVSALITMNHQVLLARRAHDPWKGWWYLPGGFLEPWEHPTEGVRREVQEETGLEVRPTNLLSIVVDRYGPHGDYLLNLFYAVEIERGELRTSGEVAELGWFRGEALPDQIAFAGARDVLDVWRNRV
jgi:ADP-ribose pyrophosphatase YjhB (NUDIX family)